MKLTDTQLVLLSAASQREDRGIELGSTLKGGAADKVLGKLLTESLVEEVPAHGAPPICRWIILRSGRPSLSNKMIAERTGLVLQTERQCHGLE